MTGFAQDDRKVFSIKGVLGGAPPRRRGSDQRSGREGKTFPLVFALVFAQS